MLSLWNVLVRPCVRAVQSNDIIVLFNQVIVVNIVSLLSFL